MPRPHRAARREARPSMRLRSLFAYQPPIEFALLVSLAITLPMFEGIKNILWGLYAGAWYWYRLRNGWSWSALGVRWDTWDTVLTVWLFGAIVGTLFSGMHGDEWRGLVDVVRMTSMLW